MILLICLSIDQEIRQKRRLKVTRNKSSYPLNHLPCLGCVCDSQTTGCWVRGMIVEGVLRCKTATNGWWICDVRSRSHLFRWSSSAKGRRTKTPNCMVLFHVVSFLHDWLQLLIRRFVEYVGLEARTYERVRTNITYLVLIQWFCLILRIFKIFFFYAFGFSTAPRYQIRKFQENENKKREKEKSYLKLIKLWTRFTFLHERTSLKFLVNPAQIYQSLWNPFFFFAFFVLFTLI